MKLNGIFGTGSGKTGNAVFATSAGKQIVRTYQPKVANPNTDAQIAQRAKFKLLSQLAAAMAPVIVISKSGLVSARNRFVQINMQHVSFEEGKASVELTKLDVTGSIKSILALQADFDSQQSAINVAFADSIFNNWEKVAYALFVKNADDKLELKKTVLVPVDEDDNQMAPYIFTGITAGNYVVFAYGMKAKTGAAKAIFDSYETIAGDTDATLETALSISAMNYSFSETKAAEVTATM